MATSYEMNLVTGARGQEHISSADDGSLYAAIYGDGKYVMNGFGYTLVNSGLIRIAEGNALINGRHCRINRGYVADLTLAAGSNGLNRIDLIVITYRKNSETDEKATLEVLTGTATSGTAVAPNYTDGNILNGDKVVQYPLYFVRYTGINRPVVNTVFSRTKSIRELESYLRNIITPPIGWIEYNENGVNPATRYSGTVWELYGVGKFEVCVDEKDSDFSSKDQEGGNKSIKLSVSQLPAHHHITKAHTHSLNAHSHSIPALSGSTDNSGKHTHKANYTQDAASGSAKTRYYPDGEIESSQNFISSSGAHSHSVTTKASTTGANGGGNTNSSAEANTTDTGNTSDINILPPYITLYRWRRVR